MPQPLFSVVIPSFNRAQLLAKCVDSVLTQTYRDFELIVVDDGSTDDTHQLILSYSEKYHAPSIKYLYQENRGAASARNLGIHSSKAEFIAFLDSDDWWEPAKLEETARFIAGFPHIKIFHTEEIWYKNGRPLNQKLKHKKPSGWVYRNALPLCCISMSTAVVHREVFTQVGLFDESMEACEDYDFWLRATAVFEVKLIPEFLTLKDGGRPDQLSASIWGLDRFRIKALEKMLSSNTLPEEDYKLTLSQLEKKCAIFSAGAYKRGKSKEAEYYHNLPLKYSQSNTV